ncbi:MAG TPA: PaaI family thioesterase [Terriglobales bacterium]|nr:PaaI family thioesterase [Terriglobales bacterium]
MSSPVPDDVRSIFDKADFLRYLGVELVGVGPDWCETSLAVKDHHRQQHGFIHAGVIATMADHTAGGAARAASGERDVITIEFKINFLRPAVGERLRCRARVLRAGKSIVVSESEVFAMKDGEEKLVAKATETLSLI